MTEAGARRSDRPFIAAVRAVNPDSIGVPMSATGHATVYDWKCVGRQARIIGQITEVDARGFIAGNWKRLE